MTPEQKLAALFAAEAPPARDYLFEARMAQAIALRELPVVPLAHTQLRAVHDPRLTGFNLHPTGLIRLGKAKLTSEQPETKPGATP